MYDRGTVTLLDALDLFLLDCEARHLTVDTQHYYKAKTSVFIRWCAEHDVEELASVTAHDIRLFLVEGRRRGLSSQYLNNLARAIRAFLNYCVRDELIERSPFDRVQMPRIERKILAAFTEEEISLVLRSCHNSRDKAICLFLLDSGVRASELIRLNIEDVDLQSGIVVVKAGKGQKSRTTFIGAKTRKQVKLYLVGRKPYAQYEPLFVSLNTGERLKRDGVGQLMGRLQNRSGVAICTCHTFRRTFALVCLRNGMNIHILARIMGHADITVLRQYLPFVEADLREAHARFGAVDGLHD